MTIEYKDAVKRICLKYSQVLTLLQYSHSVVVRDDINFIDEYLKNIKSDREVLDSIEVYEFEDSLVANILDRIEARLDLISSTLRQVEETESREDGLDDKDALLQIAHAYIKREFSFIESLLKFL